MTAPKRTLDRLAGGPESGEIRILRSLRRILRQTELRSHSLEVDHGVTQPQLICLRAIEAAGVLTQVDLSEAVHLAPSTLVGVIDRLETKGLVKRDRDRHDRRRIQLSVTASGAAKVASAPEPLHQQVQRALSKLDAQELTRIAGALDTLVELLEAEDADTAPILSSGPIPKPASLEARLPES